MIDLIVKQKRHFAGVVGAAEREVGGQCNLRMIDDTAFAENSSKLRYGQRQQLEQCKQHIPLFVAVSMRGQLANSMQAIL